MRRSSKPYLVFSTVPSVSEGKKIASLLIKKKLAACVNLVPKVRSFFRWRGRIEHTEELLLVIKTDFRHLRDLSKTVRQSHSYEIPELIACQISWGDPSYLDWLANSLG